MGAREEAFSAGVWLGEGLALRVVWRMVWMREQDRETRKSGPVIAPTDGAQDQLCTSFCRHSQEYRAKNKGGQIGRGPVLLGLMFLLVERDR